jgi:hypothetical protein
MAQCNIVVDIVPCLVARMLPPRICFDHRNPGNGYILPAAATATAAKASLQWKHPHVGKNARNESVDA